MENVRIFYKKKDRMKFISHLDMTRFMIRMLRKAEIPVWYTEGFNKHPYINFALPLSLGFESDYEAMEFKITKELSLTEIENRFKKVFPAGIELIKAANPIYKPKEIKYASYSIIIEGNFKQDLITFLKQENIIVNKKGKKGKVTEINLKPHIIKSEIILKEQNTILNIVLPAGNELNINPSLLIDAFIGDKEIFASIKRTMLFNKDFSNFE